MDQSTNNSDVLGTLSNSLADAVERVGPSLVQVNGRQRQPASGVVFADELILTAEHVLEREEDLTIQTHDGRTLPAQFVGRDPSSDLAVLKVPGLGLSPASAAGEEARVGQFVLAVGRPSESGPMASLGIVSAIGGPLRTGRGGMLEKYIRTDATPYPGFSGGPLVDTTGSVLGITTTGIAGGVALAVPSATAWRIADTISKHGRVKRGFLGISSQPVYIPEGQRDGRTQETGLLLMKVENDSPAAKGGLMLGDILVALDGQPVHDADDLQALLAGDRVGKEIPADVIRGGKLETLKVTVGQRD
ncbi:MAG: S1C family serine protease [Chloroflexia bacterium]